MAAENLAEGIRTCALSSSAAAHRGNPTEHRLRQGLFGPRRATGVR